MAESRQRRLRAAAAAGFLAAVICLFFIRILDGTATFYGGDITDGIYPSFHVLDQAIRRLDFTDLVWNTGVYAGYPLLAEGQLGAFYPLAWLTLPVLTPLGGVNAAIVLAHLMSALAACWYARLLGLSWPACIFAGLAFAFNGFAVVRTTHVPIMQGLAWLPVVLGCVELSARRAADGRAAWPCAILAGLAWGVQWLAGHPQMAFMTLILAAPYAAFRSLFPRQPAGPLRLRLLRAVAIPGAVLAIGLGLAAVYLLPLTELGAVSIRPGGRLGYADIVAYSLPLRNLATAVVPFLFGGARGDYWGLWNLAELAFYAGVPTLALALVAAPLARRNPAVAFFALAAPAALLLALGGNTPLYRLLYQLPVFSTLRAPARFVYLLDFCLLILAAFGLDRWARAARPAPAAAGGDGGEPAVSRRAGIGVPAAIAACGMVLLAAMLGLNSLLASQPEPVLSALSGTLASMGSNDPAAEADAIRQGLLRATDPASPYTYSPGLLLALTGAWLWARRSRRVTPRVWAWAGVALLMADLGWHATRMPAGNPASMAAADDSQPALAYVASQPGLQRLYWVRGDHPWGAPTFRALLYDGLSDLWGYTPLQLGRQYDFMQAVWGWDTPPSQAVLSASNVRYVVDAARAAPRLARQAGLARYLPMHPIAVVGAGGAPQAVFHFPAAAVSRLEVVSSLEGDRLPDGAAAARLTLRGPGGESLDIPLQSGIHTAHRRFDAPAALQVSATPIDADAQARDFYAAITLTTPFTAAALILDGMPEGSQFRLYGLSLVPPAGAAVELSAFMRDTYRAVFSDGATVVYENLLAQPRAYAAHAALKVNGAQAALAALSDPGTRLDRAVVLEEPDAPAAMGAGDSSAVTVTLHAPLRVELEADMRGDGYAVLSDAWYPGWRALVDGRPARVYHANLLYRAVWLEAGRHRVEFVYEPQPLWLGSAVSLATLAACAAALAFPGLRRLRRRYALAASQS